MPILDIEQPEYVIVSDDIRLRKFDKMPRPLVTSVMSQWQGLWNPSYFVSTVSENTEEQIREYLKSQKQK